MFLTSSLLLPAEKVVCNLVGIRLAENTAQDIGLLKRRSPE